MMMMMMMTKWDIISCFSCSWSCDWQKSERCLSLRLKQTVPLWILVWSNKSLLLLLLSRWVCHSTLQSHPCLPGYGRAWHLHWWLLGFQWATRFLLATSCNNIIAVEYFVIRIQNMDLPCLMLFKPLSFENHVSPGVILFGVIKLIIYSSWLCTSSLLISGIWSSWTLCKFDVSSHLLYALLVPRMHKHPALGLQAGLKNCFDFLFGQWCSRLSVQILPLHARHHWKAYCIVLCWECACVHEICEGFASCEVQEASAVFSAAPKAWHIHAHSMLCLTSFSIKWLQYSFSCAIQSVDRVSII